MSTLHHHPNQKLDSLTYTDEETRYSQAEVKPTHPQSSAVDAAAAVRDVGS